MPDKARQPWLHFQDKKIKEHTLHTCIKSIIEFDHYWFPLASLLVFYGTTEQDVDQTKVKSPWGSKINIPYQSKAMRLTLQDLKSPILACCSTVKFHLSAELYVYALNC